MNNELTNDEMEEGPRFRKRGRADTKLIERALRERWPIPEKYRKHIVDRQVQISVDPAISAREATSAAKCLAYMEHQNLTTDLKLVDKILADQHQVSHDVDIKAVTAEIEKDPDYVEFQRLRACESDTDARAVCQISDNGNGKAVADGKTPGNTRPRAGESGNGSEQ